MIFVFVYKNISGRKRALELPSLKIGDLVSRLPIIQGGMGVGISLAGLASAVANEGGIGVIAAAMIGIGEPDVASNALGANLRAFKREMQKARRYTDGIVGVNIMVALTHYADLVKAAVKEKIDIIFAGAGLPMDLPGYLTEGARTKLVPIISSPRAARLICKKWWHKYKYLPDAFVIEGPKAGGHLGFKENQINDPEYCIETLLKKVIAAVKSVSQSHGKTIPVIAAGGIYTGRDIRRILDLGAAGVQMGTRFVATHECDADPGFKQALIDARREDLVVIKSPVGMPGRAVQNRFLQDVEDGNRKPFNCPYKCIKTCSQTKSPYCIALALAGARKGKFKNGFAFAGANAYRLKKLMSVKNLIKSLQSEFSLSGTS
jgi:nitronate monooxygenase